MFDSSLWRVTDFGLADTVVALLALGVPSQFGQVPDVRFSGPSDIFQLGFEGFQGSLQEELAGRRKGVVRGTNQVQRWNSAERSWTTIAEIPGLEVYVDLEFGSIQDVPFPRQGLWSVAGDNLWTGDTAMGSVSLAKLGEDSTLNCEVIASAPAMPVTPAQREAFYEARDLTGRRSELVQRARARRRLVPVADTRPRLIGLVSSSGGGAWIGLDGASETEPRTWVQLSRQGQPLGRLELDAAETVRAVNPPYVATVETDSLGVEVAVVRRLGRLP